MYLLLTITFIENVMTSHHYTDTPVKTAAAIVNAGTCLEDANLESNIFTHIGEAINSVSSFNTSLVLCDCMPIRVWCQRTKLKVVLVNSSW